MPPDSRSSPDPRQLQALFDQALALPAHERAAFVAARSAGDPVLEGRLHTMLQAAADEALERPVPVTAARDEDVGAEIGPYRLLEQLGEGGFGRVFLAQQDEPVVRQVALKVLKLGMDTRQVVARFEQERQALAMMDHPHIARVIDAGATAAGRPFFVMELVRGLSIVEHCDRNQFAIEARLELFVQVCDAVQHAHGKGVIHRDIKSSNVLVAIQDDRPHAKVIDFGVAKATSQRLTDKTLQTEHRQMIGTLQYMSPEQAEGSLDLDTRTDVYSLGILLYELLTGSTPFDARWLRDAMPSDLPKLIRDTPPPRPSTRMSASDERVVDIARQRRSEPRQLGMRLRGELDWIVMKAIEKDRERRYDTAAALGLDVQRHLRGEAIAAAPPSTAYRLRKFVGRNRTLVGAIAAVALALVLGVIGTSIALVRALDEKARADAAVLAEGQAKTTAQQNEREAREQARLAAIAQEKEAKARQRAETIRDFVVAALRAGDASRSGGRADATIVQAMDNAIADVDSDRFRDDPATAADLRLTIANILRTNGRFDTALVQSEAALAALQELHAGDASEVAEALCEVGNILDRLGRREESERHTRESLEMYERLYSGDNYHIAALRSNLGDRLHQQGRIDEARPLLEDAVAMMRRLDRGAELAKALGNLAQLREALGDKDAAQLLYEEALAVQRREDRGDHPDLAVAINNLAVFCAGKGDVERGDALLSEALAMRQRMFHGDHPVVAESLLNLAFLRATNDKPEEAVPLLEEALAMNQRLFPGAHPNVAHGLYTLGSARLALADAAAAEEAFDQSLTMHRALFEGDHIGTAMSLAKRGRARAAQTGKESGARGDYDEALAMLRRMPEGRAPMCELIWSSAQLRLAADDQRGALTELEELVPLATAVFAAGSSRLRTYREALEACRKAVEATRR
ncbi:MAG: serine/threonine protein kinase [Planctomycetes bacterium]|nr:serine/threonine protein kinase [Planctomycetota bacterium]